MPLGRQRLKPFANRVDDRRAQDIERTGIADRQPDHAAQVAVDAAMGIEHLHGGSCHRSSARRRRVPLPGQTPALSSRGCSTFPAGKVSSHEINAAFCRENRYYMTGNIL
jgi:hypothetical protein